MSWSAGGTRLPLSHSPYQRTCVAAEGGPANSFKGKGGKSEISVIGVCLAGWLPFHASVCEAPRRQWDGTDSPPWQPTEFDAGAANRARRSHPEHGGSLWVSGQERSQTKRHLQMFTGHRPHGADI